MVWVQSVMMTVSPRQSEIAVQQPGKPGRGKRAWVDAHLTLSSPPIFASPRENLSTETAFFPPFAVPDPGERANRWTGEEVHTISLYGI